MASTLFRSAVLLAAVSLLAGCGVNSTVIPTGLRGDSVRGIVHGGQQPISGATIQLYAVGTTGDGSAATPLLTSPVTTDAGGNFSLANDFTCPTPSTQVYLTGTGGNPGISGFGSNTAIAMMAALGSCSSLGPGTYILMNEVTTIGSLAALYPYTSAYDHIGSGSGDAAQLVQAFALVNEYMNIASGTAPGLTLPANYYASSLEIDSLANSLSACVNSAGGVAGDGSVCGYMFALTRPLSGTAPTDTLSAVVNILNNPGLNASAIYSLAPAVAPFQPALTQAPQSNALPIVLAAPPPTFSLAGGTYAGSQTVTISNAGTGGNILYTVDGSDPKLSGIAFGSSTKVTVYYSQTIRAIVITSQGKFSPEADAAYNITYATTTAPPAFSPQPLYPGDFFPAQPLYLTSSTPGAVIYYQFAYAIPATYQEYYAGNPPILTGNTFVSAYAVSSLGTSSIITMQYTISANPTPAAPTLSPASGTYVTAQTVTLTPAFRTAPSSTLMYTTDGTTPSLTNGTRYTGPFTVSTTTKINAIAYTGANASPVNTAVYSILDAPRYGTISLVAGTGASGFSGDNGSATAATLGLPYGLTTYAPYGTAPNLYIADSVNNRIREVTSGTISTAAGNGIAGYNGDSGTAKTSELNVPYDVKADSSGNIYIADGNNYRIRKVTTTGAISTIAGNGTKGFSGDGGAATSAQLSIPTGLYMTPWGDYYIADPYNNRIRLVSSGTISTVAGNGVAGFSGDGGPANSAELNYPNCITGYNVAGASIDFYICDQLNNRVRMLNSTSGAISTYAGTGVAGYSGDGGPAVNATLNSPSALAYDVFGDLFIADSGNNVIRMVDPAGTIWTVAGGGTGGQGIPALASKLGTLTGLLADSAGSLYLSQYSPVTVQKITFQQAPPMAAAPLIIPPGGVFNGSTSVSMSSSTAGVSIYYTTDGSTPTTASARYTSPITVSTSETVNAIATGGGYGPSGVTSATILIH